MSKDKKVDQTLYCSFCGRSQHEVKKLIAGPTVFICDGCTLLCVDIIAEDVFFDRKSLNEVLAKLRVEIKAAFKRRLAAEKNDGGSDGGDQG